jgi:hypothetical protein
MSGAPLIALHLLLLGLGAMLVGKRVYRETHPLVGERDSVQSRRVATAATIVLFLLMVLLVLQADVGLFREPIQ